MREKRRILTVLAAAFLIVALSFSVVGCGSKVDKKKPVVDTDKNKPPSWSTPGFTIGEISMEDAMKDLAGGFYNLVTTASSETLTSSKPYVSWLIEGNIDLNGVKSDLQFGINYNHNDNASLAMVIKLLSQESGDSSAEIYFYADTEDDGTLYLAVEEQKVSIPVYNTGLTSVFPIKMNIPVAIIGDTLSSCIYAQENIKFEYQDDSQGKRTRRYVIRLDLKRTFENLLNMLKKGGDEFESTYKSVCSIIEMVFGISANKISTQLPESSLTVDYTITDGLRSQVGMGKASALNVDFSVAASSNKDTLFGGKQFIGKLNFNKLEAKNKLLGTDVIPINNIANFGDFFIYQEDAVSFQGKAYYSAKPDKLYDMTIGFLYDGYDNDDDKIKIVLSDPDDADVKAFELYYKDKMAYIAFDNGALSHTFPIDFDCALENLITQFKNKPKSDTMELIAYIISVIQYDDGYIGFKFNRNFFGSILNLDIDAFYSVMQEAYVAAGGTGLLKQIFENNGIDLNELIVSKALTIQFDISHDFIADDIEMPEF